MTDNKFKGAIKKFFLDYFLVVKKVFRNNNLKFILSTLLVIIATIFINIFTSNDSIQKFTEAGLPFYVQIGFYMGFGLIALLALFKSAIAIGTLIFIGLIVGLFLKFCIDVYSGLLRKISEESSIIIYFFLIILEMAGALFIVLKVSSGLDHWLILAFLLMILGSTTLGMMINKIDKWEKEKDAPKTYNPPLIDKEMKGKIKFTIWIIFLLLVGISFSIFLANKLGLIAHFKYINIIITTSVFFAGFGLLALSKGGKTQDNFWAVILPSRRSITLWPIVSIILAFCYIAFETSKFATMFFELAVAFLFFTITLIVLLVFYHDNKYLREIETNQD